MVRVLLVCLAMCAVAATPAAADPVTPDGPATLKYTYTGPAPPIPALPQQMLTGFRITVGAGGSAGTVRLRVVKADGSQVLGDPVQVPATPGTYEFPAPRVHGGVLGLDQTTGGHAILRTYACRPDLGSLGDPCQIMSVDAFKGDPPPGTAGTPDEKIAGAQLAIESISARDMDSPDLHAGDNTITRVVEPLPPLTLTAAAHQRLARGIATRVRLAQPGRVRVVASFRVHGRRVRFARSVRLPAGKAHAVTLRPRGADRRALRAAGRAKGSLAARRVDGHGSGSVRLTLTR